MATHGARWAVVMAETTPEILVIRDVGHASGSRTVTNDVERVIHELAAGGYLPPDRRLMYYDSGGDLDEIVLSRAPGGGVPSFAGFRYVSIGVGSSDTLDEMDLIDETDARVDADRRDGLRED